MILNIYPYGSRVYGVADEQSDTDMILVSEFSHEQETQYNWFGTDITVWSAAEFQRLLDIHEPSALECYFLPDEMAIRSMGFMFRLDLEKLRRAFSEKSSNSWVKAKKKIEVHGEWRIGLKSLFHSMRLLEFGIQIAKEGRITDYGAANNYWRDIRRQQLGLADFNNFTSWQDYKEYWQPKYNKLRSDFRVAAPIEK
jgi:hypothetical protein